MLTKAVIYAGATVNIEISFFILQYLSHICMDFYTTKNRRSAVKIPKRCIVSEIVIQNRQVLLLIIMV